METAQVDALAATISHLEEESELFQEDCSHVSSLIAAAVAKFHGSSKHWRTTVVSIWSSWNIF